MALLARRALVRRLTLGLGVLVCLLGMPPRAQARQAALLVSAAADLTFALQELGTAFTRTTGIKVLFNFGSTGQLAQQIARGAPVDLFAAANVSFVDMLARQGLVIPGTKKLYARGRLTLWMRADSPLRFSGLADLLRPQVRRIAIANPAHAPYGMAAREALQTAGLWERVQPKLVMGENVRQALQYAATGNVEVAMVALSLSMQHQGRWVLVPETLHRPILQALAVIRGTRHEAQARQFAAFVLGPQGQATLRKYGFCPPLSDVHQ